MPKLSLSLLGAFRASYGGTPLTRFGSNKVQALLIYLTVEKAQNPANEPLQHQREQLMELLWPGVLPKSAQNNLRQTIYKLRQIIPTIETRSDGFGDFIFSERQTVQLNTEPIYQLDVADFEQRLQRVQAHEHTSLHGCSRCQTVLQQAVDLYKGEFLADFYIEDSSAFEDWAWNWRAYFRRLVLDALETLTLMMTQQNQLNQARAYAEKQLVIDNLRESAYRQLMEILALSGQPSEAVAQYDRLCQLLHDEMGMAPMAKTTAVYEAIRSGELRLSIPSQTAVRGYDLQEAIGSGSFGVVHRAVQPYVNRDVAIKIIAPDYANKPDFIRRFESEAQLVARLEHPFIVPLYDYWREPDAAYLVMRYLRGGSLQQQIKKGPSSPQTTARILEQVCAALQVAHQQQIVHRDIKPANILLDEAGNAYLSDFGIAKELGSQRQLTEAGAIIGTLDYISPEQFINEPISPASDIYSLGIVLFQMLIGRLPFPESSISELIYKHLHEQLPSVHKLRPELSTAVDKVIWHATEKDPKARFPTTIALASAFEEALHAVSLDEFVIKPVMSGIELYNPYKGLHPFQEADSEDFFGRQALVQTLITRLDGSPQSEEDVLPGSDRFLAVVGPSGSGKSSVVKAGLIPALRKGEIPGSENWYFVEMVPGSHPLEELEGVLLQVAVNPPPTLLEPLQKDRRGLVRTLKRVLPAAPGDERPQLLLFIDQFEELFTLVEDRDARQHFIDTLVTALKDSHSQLRLVITLRADFYDRPLQLPALGKLLRQRTEVVLPLTIAELEQAIIRPAARMGVRFEAGLAAEIAADVAEQPGALPLLQYALTELFEQRHNNIITSAAYERVGGVLSVLGRRAEEIFNTFEGAKRPVARQLFLRLVTLGEGIEDTRRRVLRTELHQLETPGVYNPKPVLDSVIEAYGRYRLLTFDHDPVTRSPTVEVAHEALLREWGRLRGWLDQYRDDVRQQRRLAQATSEWLQNERDVGYLLRGSRLDQFANWMNETHLALTSEERELLETSLKERESRQKEETERRQRELETAKQLAKSERQRAEEQIQTTGRLRRFAVGLSMFLMVSVVTTLIAFNQQTVARENAATAATQESLAIASLARAEQLLLAAEALNALDGDSTGDLAALLALRSLQSGYTPQADRALVRAMIRGFTEHTLTGHSDEVRSLTISPDGRTLVSAGGDDSSIRFWDVATGKEQRTLLVPEQAWSVAVAPDHSSLIVGTGDGMVHQYDWRSLELTRAYEVSDFISSAIWAVAYSPDGQKILAAGQDSKARIFDARTGEREMIFVGHVNEISTAMFSLDGEQILTGSLDHTIRLWDSKTGDEIRVFEGHQAALDAIALSPDGRQIISTGYDGTARLWDISSGNELYQVNIGEPLDFETDRFTSFDLRVDVPYGAAFQPGGRIFATTGLSRNETNVVLWDVESGQFIRSWGAVGYGPVLFTPAGATIAVSHGPRIYLLRAQVETEPRIIRGHNRPVQKVAFSPDGKFLITVGGSDGQAKVWDSSNGQLRYATEQSGFLIDAGFGSDNETVWLINWDRYEVVRWNLLDSSEQIVVNSGPPSGLAGYGLSPSGSRVVMPGIRSWGWVYETDSGDLIQQISTNDNVGITSDKVEYSPDEKTLLTSFGSGSEVQLWDTVSGDQTGALVGHSDFVTSKAVSPDGRFALTGSADQTVRLWDLSTQQEVQQFSLQVPVFRVAYGPHGRLIAAAGDDYIIRIWDLETGQQIRVLDGHESPISSIAFSPDGSLLASGSALGTINLWRVHFDVVVQMACEQLSRDLTLEERNLYNIQGEQPTCP